MKIGFSGEALGRKYPFDKICDIATKYNLTTCEIWPHNVEGEGHGYKNKDLKKIKDIATNKGVTIECVTFACPSSIGSETYSKLFCDAIEKAAGIGALRMNHYCGSLCPNEADFNVMEQFWSEPLKTAEKNGIILALENEAHDATRTPDRMLKIINHFNSKNFKTNLDVTNYYEGGTDGFPNAYETLKEHIGYVHLKNAHRYPDGFRWVQIPDGVVHVSALVLKIAQEGTYTGLCSLEPHVQPDEVESYFKRESKYLFDVLKDYIK